MSRRHSFDTIWRERFNPAVVYISPDQYRDWLPAVRVVPWGVPDEQVFAVDDRFQKVVGKSFRRVNELVEAVPPRGVGISMRQLVQQIPSILSGAQPTLRVFAQHRLLKQVPIGAMLLEECRRLQAVILERLLLFEDLPSVLRPEEVDEWANSHLDALTLSTHQFRRGQKVDVLLRLLETVVRPSKKVVVFVRNIPVCEAVWSVLIEAGMRATFLHGEVESARSPRLEQFRRGDTDVLVVTRQLFGRGFDIPQADTAIFYSPKESERTMWQEMLRIRSTVRHAKDVIVLFYLWTAEETKMMRLLRRMLRTGAVPNGSCWWWRYFEEEEGPEEREGLPPRRPLKVEENGGDLKSATNRFVDSLIDGVDRLRRFRPEDMVRWMGNVAGQSNFSNVWPADLVGILLPKLIAALAGLCGRKDVTLAVVKRELSKVLHPDKHHNAVGIEKQFWHELFVALQM
jgi:hypothetical protein